MLRAGNFGNSAFGAGGYVGLDGMETAFEDHQVLTALS